MANSTVTVNTQNLSDNFKFEVVKGPTGINAISISNTGSISLFDPYKTPGNILDLQDRENIFGQIRPYLNAASFSTHFGTPDQYLTTSPGGLVSFDTNNAIYFVNNMEYNDWQIALVGNVTSDPFNYYYETKGPAIFFEQEVIWFTNNINSWDQSIYPYDSAFIERFGGPYWEKIDPSGNSKSLYLDSGEYQNINNNTTYNSFYLDHYPTGPRRVGSRGGHINLRTQDNPSWNDSSILQLSYYTQNTSYHSIDQSLFGTTVPNFVLGTNSHSVNNVIVFEDTYEEAVVVGGTGSIVQGGTLVLNHTLLTNGFKLITGTFTESEGARLHRATIGTGYNYYIYSFKLPNNIVQSMNLVNRVLNGFATTNNENIYCHLRPKDNEGTSPTLQFIFSGSNTSVLTPYSNTAPALQVTWMMIGK